jgi:hypothetical protein
MGEIGGIMWLRPQHLLFLALSPAPFFGASVSPIKLAAEINPQSIESGEKIVIQVALLDAANRPAPAPKSLPVLLQARQASGEVKKLGTVTIGAGQLSKRTAVSVPGSGLVYIWAKNPELLPGGQFVQVRRANPKPPPPSPTSVVRPRPELGTPAAQSVRALPRITLRFSPDRPFLADGRDAATVQAFLVGPDESIPANILLNVYDSSHSMNPAPLSIPAGEPNGQSVLTSTAPGDVTVEFLGSVPPTDFDGDKNLKIHFMPPITRLALRASPPNISLVDGAELIATLTNDQGMPIAAAAPRVVAFSIDSGHAQLGAQQMQIAAGQFEVRTTFTPQWAGATKVSVSTPNLLTATAPVQVSIPVGLLLCSIAGGLIGGLLSPRSRRKADRWRPAVGVATGFLLYWACIFLGLSNLSRGLVLNPLSALAISAIGGWLQMQVFSSLSRIVQPSGTVARK